MKSALVQVRVDQETKDQADRLFTDLGLDTATAVRIFLRQAIKGEGLPFEVRKQPRYNGVTEAAMAEAAAMAEGRLTVPTYASWGDFEASLDDED
ncbi:MAG: type II toxin-antitoxin system RelB/DinJ family antitoxin [Propionibacteriaceae bacterium]|nr:type II toxin-antitoxin system RelB/DinJ family antitoxin [Propionibacteriaceae bacterium]